ncbi:hypothetical protein CDR68_24345 [Salmonella enterica]|nr:hypothetical protein [Salmonella enterica]
MKIYLGAFFLFPCSCIVNASDMAWENECIGYYQLQLPSDLEVGVYPAKRIYTEDTGGIKAIFGEYHEFRGQGKNVSGPYSGFYYENYLIMPSGNDFSNLDRYRKQVTEHLSNNFYDYNIKNYLPDVFFLSYEYSHSLYISKNKRLYQFMKGGGREFPPLGANKNNFNLNNESDVNVLLERFHTRELYEIPTGKGFCLPYGFIANDSGAEDRDIAVTYRMKSHPDVMIVFQDASYQLPYKIPLNADQTPMKNYDAKDYAKWLWNKVYMIYPGKRELLSSGWFGSGWFSIEMDGRKGSGSFLQVTREDGKKDYGYLAFVRADPTNSTEKPDLQVYVSSYSFLATKEHPQISPDELKTLAEHIVSSVKHR